jgi:hypothetical protein
MTQPVINDTTIIANGTPVAYHGSLSSDFGPEYSFTVITHEIGSNGVTYLVAAKTGQPTDDVILRGVRPTSISE